MKTPPPAPTPVPGDEASWIHAAGRVLLLALWAAQVLLAVIPVSIVSDVAVAALCLLLVIGLRRPQPETLLVWAAAVVVGVPALVASGVDAFANLREGLAYALLFAALLPTLQLVRAVAVDSAGVRASQARLARLGPAGRVAGFAFGTFGFGAILNTGAYAIMSATLPADAPREERLACALASVRGLNLCMLWSPFFVSVAVVLHHLDGVAYWQVLASGLCLAGIGAMLSGAIFSARERTDLARVLGCLAPVGALLGVAGLAVAVVGQVTRLTMLQALVVVMPLLCLVEILPRAGAAGRVARRVHSALDRSIADLCTIAGAMILGKVIEGSPLPALLAAHLPALGTPSWLAVALVVLFMVGAAAVGIHPMITGTIVLGAAGVLAQILPEIVIAQAVLVGWAAGTMVSISALTLVIAAGMFKLRLKELIASRNLAFVAAFTAAAVAALSGLTAYLGPG